ncbi:MAG: LysM peptidoglycan-binding domain-containing protein [Caldilineaceae bacterium]|nr:LysM peptidoglycan-binding domain-containing protein [Caldilineaceae bacterium]
MVANQQWKHRYARGWAWGLGLWLASLVGMAFLPAALWAACPNPYLVQANDGWIKIANRCGVTYAALREANLALWQQQGERLYVGDQLQIPQGAPPSPSPPWTPLPPSTPPSPGPNPREQVRLFWQAVIVGLRTGDFRPAYGYLTPRLQDVLTYPAFQASFANTREITIESLATVQENGPQALVDAVIITAEYTTGDWRYQRERYRYRVLLLGGVWRLDSLDTLGSDPTPSCPNTVPTRLQRGMRAYVLPQPPTPNRVFQEPNRQSPLVGRIYPGEAMLLRDGPRCAQQSVWWYVHADNGVIGWTAEGQPGEYWLAPVNTPPPAVNTPPPPSGNALVGPITFCTTVDRANRCQTPTTHFPIGLQRIEVNWSFQNLPLQTTMTHLWYHNGNLFFTRPHVVWGENRHQLNGFGYTFYAPLGGLPTGQWRLEFRRQSDNHLLQSATFSVGPIR